MNRCIYIEGIGRCHVIDDGNPECWPAIAAMDVPSGISRDAVIRADAAAAVLFHGAPGIIRWSVRFKERAPVPAGEMA